jgi:hypothetical protein
LAPKERENARSRLEHQPGDPTQRDRARIAAPCSTPQRSLPIALLRVRAAAAAHADVPTFTASAFSPNDRRLKRPRRAARIAGVRHTIGRKPRVITIAIRAGALDAAPQLFNSAPPGGPQPGPTSRPAKGYPVVYRAPSPDGAQRQPKRAVACRTS